MDEINPLDETSDVVTMELEDNGSSMNMASTSKSSNIDAKVHAPTKRKSAKKLNLKNKSSNTIKTLIINELSKLNKAEENTDTIASEGSDAEKRPSPALQVGDGMQLHKAPPAKKILKRRNANVPLVRRPFLPRAAKTRAVHLMKERLGFRFPKRLRIRRSLRTVRSRNFSSRGASYTSLSTGYNRSATVRSSPSSMSCMSASDCSRCGHAGCARSRCY